ncbi:hypothetical protein WR25_08373 [Diploscapter pachys]|uniref:BHLH domain-containing protein n=1 Tax=Diploscapter pachys TaxID=2018661 RepID=A0A2A2L246_9BILA|nr:hypothetical protein WR25_08373 [Diploscapter pachys]
MSQKSKSQQPQRLKRNERERKRVDQVNQGFNQLRERVPKSKGKQKLSKVETLREAVNYIRQLKSLLGDATLSQMCSYSEQLIHCNTSSFNSSSGFQSNIPQSDCSFVSSCSYFPPQYNHSMCNDNSPNSSFYSSNDSGFEEKKPQYYIPAPF